MTRRAPAGDPPAVALEMFGDRVDLAQRYADMLASDGVERGLIGPREVGRLWDRHLLNCAVIGELVAPDADVLDIGSGAGLPGVPLALARPDLHVILVEPLERRCTFLLEVQRDLGLDVEVVRARAEDVGRTASIVTARAVAPLRRLVPWCLPLVGSGGRLLAMKGRSAAEEVRRDAAALRRVGAVVHDVVQCGVGLVEPPATVVAVGRTSEGEGRGRAVDDERG